MAEALSTGLGANLVTEFVKSISGTIKQQVLYMFKHKSYINVLNDQVQQLKHKRERVEMRVDRARRQGDEIYEDVVKWLKDVERFIEQEANPITGNEGQAGTCSFITRYKVGRKAVKAAKGGSSLLGKDLSDVSYRPVLQRTESMYVDRDYEAFDPRESILSEIMEALINPNVNGIGVYGMGGVGKTTLVKKVAWQAKQDKLFDDVAMAEVTQTPDNKTIQEAIACDLGLEFGQHESELVRANRIRTRLKKGKRVLVILDNIWAKPGLEAIGIPWENDHEKGTSACGKEDYEGMNDERRLYKILVTSRSRDVLRDKMNTSKNFWVKTLSDKDSLNLFRKFVGNSLEKPDFLAVAKEIVGKCGGLPLAVSVIAKALKYKEFCAWEAVLDQLKGSNPIAIPEMREDVFSVIKLSFDLLASHEAKSLLMLFSLVDAGTGSTLDYMLRYCMGLGLFQDVHQLVNGRNRVEKLANDLKASSLLLEGRNKTFFKMHEVVHAVARSIASTNELMFNIPDVPDLNQVLHEKISKNPLAISLPGRDIYELPKRLECSKLELLFLFSKSHSLTIPNNFFEGVKELKVIDMDCINLMPVPLSFGYLTNLQTLCLDECLLGDISIIGQLTNLKILSFSRSNIERLPGEIGQLTQLQLLDLSECSSLKAIQVNVISRLSLLEELDLEHSFVQWEDGLNNRDGYNANLAELNQLSDLTTLRICIPDAQIIPQSLSIQKLKRFKILIGDVWNWSHSFEASRMLKLKLNKISYLAYRLIKILLKATDDLFLDELNGVQNVLYEVDEEGFLNLKYLHVQNGPKLRYIVNAEGQIPCDAFLMLESLSLNNLVNLVKICDGPLKEASFNKLKVLKVNKCDELKHLFSISMVKCLLQLQKIEVTNCKNLQVIFAQEDDKGHLHDESETNSKIEFTQIRSLTLQFLPQFSSFGINMKTRDDTEDFKILFGKRVGFPRLENLILSSINIEKICSVGAFEALRTLAVEGCNGLKFLFSSSMVKSLMQLQYLKISKCKLMEVVINTKALEGEATISFPELLHLRLEDLPKLTRFGIGNLVEFPSMNVLGIIKCPNLRTFFSNSTCEILSNNPEKMSSGQSIEPLFSEKVGLPSLETLAIFRMLNLRKIWDHQLRSDSFGKLRRLLLIRCNKLGNIFPSSMLGRLHALDYLKVRSCDSLKEIFEFQALNDQKPLAIVATQLRELDFDNLPKLKHIWNMNAQQIRAFENLIKIRVSSCYDLKSLFPASIAKRLLKLEELVIDGCDMNEIVAKEESLVEERSISRFKFPRLSSLELSRMPFLESFCSKEHISEWPALKMMKVSFCSNIKILSSELQGHQDGESQLHHLQALFFVDKVAFPNLKELKVSDMDMLLHLWVGNSQPSRLFQNLENLKVSKCRSLKDLVPSTVSLCNLQTLEVSECDQLINLMTLLTARSLVNFKRMDIADCRMTKEIIAHEGDEAINDDDQIVFNQLNYLRLHALPSLTSFCTQSYSIEFPQLEQVIIGKYTMMKMFCPGVVRTPKLHKVLSTEEDDDQGQGNLNTTTRLFFNELVGFRGVESLKLSKFPQLKEIWHCQLPFSVFCNLRSLEVDECAHLSSAISTNMLLFLNNLKHLCVRNCNSVEEVFDLEKLNDNGHLGVLSQLRKFSLINLPRLKYIRRSHQEILDFQSLRFLEVQDCGNLRYIFTLAMISGLKVLQAMKISNCVTMEVIIIDDGKKDAANEIVLPKLESIILDSLPELTSFYSGSNMVVCPSLKTTIINGCTKMGVEDFILGHLKYSKAPKTEEADEWCLEGDLNTSLQYMFKEKVGLPSLETLAICRMLNLRKIWDDQLCSDSFGKLRRLLLISCNKLGNIFPSSMLGRLHALDSLRVWDCDSLKEIFEFQALNDQKPLAIVATQLRELDFDNLPKLKHIWNMNAQQILAFENLIKIRVSFCYDLKSLFPVSIAKRLLQLEELVIDGCDMNEIVAKEESVVEEASISRFKFPRLSSLELSRMPFLESFCSKEHISQWPALKMMKVSFCSNIKILSSELQGHQEGESQLHHLQALFFVDKVAFPNLEELKVSDMDMLLHLWVGNSQPSRLFQNLENLKVSNCRSLKDLVPSTVSLCNLQTLEVSECDQLINLVTLLTAGSLVNVKRMDIADCRVTKEIIAQKGAEAINDDDQIVFNQLNYLRLHALPSLTSFCTQSYAIEFPQLEQVIIGKYTMMKMFCPGVVRTPKLHKVLSTEEDGDQGHWQGNLNTTTRLFFNELVGFRGVESLKLSKFPQLKEIWHCQLPFSVFCNLRSLEVDECAHLSSAISTNMLLFLNKLKHLCVRNCNSVEEVFDLEKLNDNGHLGVLSQLRKFRLINLPRLKYIRRSHQEILDFQSLRFLEVQDCGNLRYIFTLAMISGLKLLQAMKISNCVTMDVIIIEDGKKDAANEIVLPKLESIILDSLPELTIYYSGSNMVVCPSLKTTIINGCTKIGGEDFILGHLKYSKAPKTEEADERCLEGDLNTSLQYLFKEKNAQTSEEG